MTPPVTFTAYITRYALSTGIYCVNADEGRSATMITVRVPARGGRAPHVDFYHKPDWHRSEADAIAHALEMRHKKLVALERLKAKLEKTVFTVRDMRTK